MAANRYICQKVTSFPYAQYGKNIIFHNTCQAFDQNVMDKVWKGYERYKTPIIMRELFLKKWLTDPVFAGNAS